MYKTLQNQPTTSQHFATLYEIVNNYRSFQQFHKPFTILHTTIHKHFTTHTRLYIIISDITDFIQLGKDFYNIKINKKKVFKNKLYTKLCIFTANTQLFLNKNIYNFTKLYKYFTKTIHNFTKLGNTLRNSTQLYKPLNNFTNTHIHNSTNTLQFYTPQQHCTSLYNT